MVLIPENELEITFSRSSGPGGQNVNKLSTKANVRFHIANSETLSERQKSLISSKLKSRIDSEGFILVSSQKHRSQSQNREDAIDRLHEILNKALVVQKKRVKTKVPKSQKQKRLENKKSRGEIKKLRSEKF